jgi:hypothetical protein
MGGPEESPSKRLLEEVKELMCAIAFAYRKPQYPQFQSAGSSNFCYNLEGFQQFHKPY